MLISKIKTILNTEIKRELNNEHRGFMGYTHWLQSNAIFMCMWLIPATFPVIGAFASNHLAAIKSSWMFLILNFMIMGGAALMPDLDSSPLEDGGSTAVSQLGLLGLALSTVAMTLSHVTFTILHLPGDDKPKSAHRMLWHTFLIPTLFYLWVNRTFPQTNDTIKGMLSADGVMQNLSVFGVLFFYAIAIYIGISMATYRFFRLIKKQRYVQFVSWGGFATSLIAMTTMPYYQLRLLGITLAIGYGLHVFEDLFSQGSSPALFPIPIPKNGKFQLWFKGFLPFGLLIETGGVINKILDYIFLGIDVLLLWYIFIR